MGIQWGWSGDEVKDGVGMEWGCSRDGVGCTGVKSDRVVLLNRSVFKADLSRVE